MRALSMTLCVFALAGCAKGHGPIADDISAPLGFARPDATAEEQEVFARGEQVAQRRFARADGLGPGFNVTFCAACHEKPTFGGAAGLYRNFSLAGRRTSDGAFLPAVSADNDSGVVRLYQLADGLPDHPELATANELVAQRNPIPFYGVGLLAELDEDEILRRADPDDRDGDGISGRPNYDRGFVGRFGVKAQTVSIEGFIRGPLFNHLGITTDPLSEAQKAALPVPSALPVAAEPSLELGAWLSGLAQVSAPDGPLVDEDGVPDPELSTEALFDLVAWAMLLAAPAVEEPGEAQARGLARFDEAGCDLCHTPRLQGPRGPLPVYSDLLLHDMGPELADGQPFGEASGSEFRTQPLWGIGAVGPYLHDGRAHTLREAIEAHGGEGGASRDAFTALPTNDQQDLLAFLLSLGGRSQTSAGLLPPGAPVPEVGAYGGPARALSPDEAERFVEGRAFFDREFGLSEGAGAPRFNGDSCRACHFEPVVGGAGPRGVNVMRHGLLSPEGGFIPPAVGTILHRLTRGPNTLNRPQAETTHFEARQTPHLFGLGAIEGISDEVILANADPDDTDGDGISGRASVVDGGRLGRLGWKAQVPSLAEFVRDAVGAELGMTLPIEAGLTFGRVQDNDGVPDPELSLEEVGALLFYLQTLAAPPRSAGSAASEAGELQFASLGCDRCHRVLLGADGPVPLYSDLLLHAVLPPGARGIEEASASMEELRTPPLWGVSRTAPYLHDGSADTLAQAIAGHDGEAAAIRDAFLALPEGDRADLIAFLGAL